MCIECFNTTSLERRGHFVNIDVAHKICCDKLEQSAANLRTFQHELREQIELCRRLIVELEKNSSQLSTEIVQKCDEIVTRVNVLKAELLKKVEKERTEKEHQIITQLGQFLHLESPMSINLLSISIFCSYASKIDVLHCYADLHKQFLSTNGQLLQKVKFDCAINVDFVMEFNQAIGQPMGLLPTATTPSNVFLNCNLNQHEHNHTQPSGAMHQDSGQNKKDSSDREITPLLNNGFGDRLAGDNINAIELIGDSLDVQNKNRPPTFALNDGLIHFNSFQSLGHLESENLSDQRFLELHGQIANPVRKFAQEIFQIAKSLMNLQKDITLRRCVVNGEELTNRINCCEEAWERLEVHSRQVHKILNHQMGQLWRKEIERVQRQQQAVREKMDEMKQLQKLAKRALMVSQQLKPFATQMASLISVIDVRRSGPAMPSPMEQICQEIAQIEPDSLSRVAAIEKEEESRRLAKLGEEQHQLGQREAVQMRRNLKEVRHPPVTAKQHQKTSLVLEMDRDRAPSSNATNSCMLSPMVAKKRQQLHSRAHRNSESALGERPSATSPSKLMMMTSEELTSLEEMAIENSNQRQMHEKPSAIVSPLSPINKTEIAAENMRGSGEEQTGGIARVASQNVATTEPSAIEAVVEESTEQASRTSSSTGSSATLINILRSQTQDRDPALVAAREKLLESIREKVKRID